jgi:hypothetical protein
MARFALLGSVLVLALFGVALLAHPSAGAQEATPTSTAVTGMATHPLVGTWTLLTTTRDGTVYPSVAVFHSDGSYLEVLPWGSPLLGVWAPTGAHTAVVTQVVTALANDRLVLGQGRAVVEVDATGTTLTWHGVFVNRFTNGSLESVDEVVSLGTRLTAAPMLSLPALEATPQPFPMATPVS